MLIENESIILKNVLNEWINKSDEVMICTPFISSNDVLFDLMERKIKFTLICRLSHPASPELFEKLLNLSTQNKSIYVYDESSLHSKVYLFKRKNKSIAAIVGSSNFTGNGIYSNKECNLLISENLIEIDIYFKSLILQAYGKLDNSTISYYRTFYKKVEIDERYRKAKISKKLSLEYSDILDKYFFVKGLLEQENNINLPFTYVFDAFCHFFKTRIVKDYELTNYKAFNKKELQKYFKLFLSDYIDDNDLNWRRNRYDISKNIRNNLHTLTGDEIKSFFLGIHSITSGSGSGVRKQNIETIDTVYLKDLLDFILNKNLSMPHKYSVALTDRSKKGLKIDYIGASSIGEIPGWLIPEKYPIKNGKLHYIFDFFDIR